MADSPARRAQNACPELETLSRSSAHSPWDESAFASMRGAAQLTALCLERLREMPEQSKSGFIVEQNNSASAGFRQARSQNFSTSTISNIQVSLKGLLHMTAITIVVPVYNAEAWLPRFVTSLQSQTFKDFEALFVDDASTDASHSMLAGYASADPRFKLLALTQKSGCGTARNHGIRQASGETICFADPDDILPEHSLAVRYAAYKKHKAIVRACHDEIMDDGTVHNHETPPSGIQNILCKPAADSSRFGVNPFLCAHWTWLFPTNFLRRNNIFNGEDMRTAEDIAFLTRLFFHVQRLVWIPDTVYYWMKRSGSLSNTMYTPQHYADYFQCCDIFYEEALKNRQVRLADIFYNNYLIIYLNHLLWQVSTGKSSEADAREVVAAMTAVSSRHNVFGRCLPEMRKHPQHHEGLWRLWHIHSDSNPSMILRLAAAQTVMTQIAREAEYAALCQKGWSQEVAFDALDTRRGLLRARYLFCDSHPEEAYDWSGVPQEPAFAKNRTVHAGNNYTIFERLLWLALPADGEGRCRLTVSGQPTGLDHTEAQLREAFTPRSLDDRSFPPEARALRRLVRSRAMRDKFENAWLFIDKDTEADDNAEHLYRWVRRHHGEVNAWFVLNQDAPDWPRLQAEGFRLVAHGSMEHGALFLLCDKLVSSQMDRYIFNPLEDRYFTDFPRPQFVCLPHGVTKDDVSDWFNSIPFEVFIAATNDEKASITNDATPYVMTDKEVFLGGFPRYDKWLEPGETENIVFVMPTWRADLVGSWDGKGQRRDFNQTFYDSAYVKIWRDVFADPRLKELLDRFHYRIVFFAHPCFADYLDGLPFPDFVEKRSKAHGSMIDIMKRSKILITDFSSVAYDMAYMLRPVIYYQQEDKDAFTRRQQWVSGYIDYETMGFGPVCRDKDALLAALADNLQTDGVMRAHYAARVEKTFAYRDRSCCQRAFDSIMTASRPFAQPVVRGGDLEE